MSDIQNKLVIDGQGFGSGQCTLGVNSSEYRDRLIVAHSIEGATCDVRDFGYKITWRNGCVQDSKGNALTPQLDCSFVLATSLDHGTNTYYSGWAMLGDFIFLVGQKDFSWESDNSTQIGVALWDFKKHADISGKEISFDEAWQLATLITKESSVYDGLVPREGIHQDSYVGGFQEFVIRSVRFIDALNAQGNSYDDPVMEMRGKTFNIICDGSLDAVQDVARIYVDGFGWRWLFPGDPADPSKSLSALKQTDSINDWNRMKPLLKDLTEEERILVQRHFLSIAWIGSKQGNDAPQYSLLGRYDGSQVALLRREKTPSNDVNHPDLFDDVKASFSNLDKLEA